MSFLFSEEEVPTGSGKAVVASKLKSALAALFVSFIQYKNIHWHVSGATFRDVHLLFDEATDVILDSIDDVGERIVAFGEVAPSSMQSLAEPAYGFPGLAKEGESDATTCLRAALESTLCLISCFKEIADVSGRVGEYGVEQLAGDIIVKLEKLQYKYQQFLK